ncbi:phosphoenolpyruvate carboxykinase [Platysternon megacephalum]|uniref:Phosphoenolpyruvate carboxykinase n=1 Tax=Platysternon megacephalum TaxID=55544 RepID=A0A4D9DI67_9SAUR|nr:phosphoenolpyruvate carboxykinase [Platysternon megacephalum]
MHTPPSHPHCITLSPTLSSCTHRPTACATCAISPLPTVPPVLHPDSSIPSHALSATPCHMHTLAYTPSLTPHHTHHLHHVTHPDSDIYRPTATPHPIYTH